MPNARHEMIIHIIQTNEVTTQEMLRDLLEEKGFPVTQATISRDIRQLKLKKKRTAAGKNCYAQSHADLPSSTSLMTDVVQKIDYAINTVVVTCHAGTAQAACAVLDKLQLPEIVGTIAGDDTIFILTRSESSAKQLLHRLETHIWG
ncbi:MAG: ArgR family transcriptional regulator [Oscillospiraceae bacterium]|nr:ArgR family transcriptional regulator [Oscillospiraceae bacterium]